MQFNFRQFSVEKICIFFLIGVFLSSAYKAKISIAPKLPDIGYSMNAQVVCSNFDFYILNTRRYGPSKNSTRVEPIIWS